MLSQMRYVLLSGFYSPALDSIESTLAQDIIELCQPYSVEKVRDVFVEETELEDGTEYSRFNVLYAVLAIPPQICPLFADIEHHESTSNRGIWNFRVLQPSQNPSVGFVYLLSQSNY